MIHNPLPMYTCPSSKAKSLAAIWMSADPKHDSIKSFTFFSRFFSISLAASTAGFLESSATFAMMSSWKICINYICRWKRVVNDTTCSTFDHLVECFRKSCLEYRHSLTKEVQNMKKKPTTNVREIFHFVVNNWLTSSLYLVMTLMRSRLRMLVVPSQIGKTCTRCIKSMGTCSIAQTV